MDTNFKYEIEKHIATLSTDDTGSHATELNLISYNGYPAKLDLRKWDKQKNQMLKGLTLTDAEAKVLRDALNGLDLK